MATYRTDKTKAEILSAFQNNKRVIVKGGPFINQESNIQQFIVSQTFFQGSHDDYYQLAFLGINSGNSYLLAQNDDEYFYYDPNRR